MATNDLSPNAEKALDTKVSSANIVLAAATFFAGIEILFFFGDGARNRAYIAVLPYLSLLCLIIVAVLCVLTVNTAGNAFKVGSTTRAENAKVLLNGAMAGMGLGLLMFSITLLTATSSSHKGEVVQYDCTVDYMTEGSNRASMRCLRSPATNNKNPR